MKRRTWALVVALALVASACGDDDDATGAAAPTATAVSAGENPAPEATEPPSEPSAAEPTPEPEPDPTPTVVEEPVVTIALVDHPYWDNTVAVAAPEALDAAAAHYVAANGVDAEMERFLFGSLPVDIFDELFVGVDDERRAELFWMLHLSGYFGGRWLRGEIAGAQPNAPLVAFSLPPTEESFVSTIERAQARLEALSGSDEEVIAAARAALFDTPPAAEGDDPIRGVADSFGYNVGYMLEILATPPEGVQASPQFEVTCDGLFACTYTSPKLAVLPELADVQALINSDDPPDPELVAELTAVQDGAEPRGRGVWSGGLSVQGFSQESYDQLLDVSSSFLETVQATALINVSAAANADVQAARVGLVAEAAQIVWLDAYIAGLTNGEGEIELPTFVIE